MKAFISRRDFLKAAGITAAAAALAGCSSSGGSASGSSAGGKTIKIGVFEPASGDNGAGGKQEVLGVEYANSLAPTVEIGGETYNVELVEVDNQSSTDKAVTAAQELVSKKVSIVLGSYGSGVSIAAAPTFQYSAHGTPDGCGPDRSPAAAICTTVLHLRTPCTRPAPTCGTARSAPRSSDRIPHKAYPCLRSPPFSDGRGAYRPPPGKQCAECRPSRKRRLYTVFP